MATPRPGPDHWDAIYAEQKPTEVSWFEAEPAVSLGILDHCGTQPDASVVDVGAGASALVGTLWGRGFRDVTALDVSRQALAIAQQRLGTTAAITWVVQDVLTWAPDRRYDVWLDRAVFHFLTADADRHRYLSVLSEAVAPNGLVVIGTFALDGPAQCSGLPVARYDPPALVDVLGSDFHVLHTRRTEHVTPTGCVQPFTWIAAKRRTDLP